MIHEYVFKPSDWNEVQSQPGVTVPQLPDTSLLVLLAADPWSRTLRTESGRAVAVVGIHCCWANRAECWAIIDQDCTQEFLAIHRICRRILFEECPLRRVEAVVECDFIQGHRWMRLLGFQQEAARMRNYYPNGRDCALYSRIRAGV